MDQSFHLFVICSQKSNAAALSAKSTATGVKCPRGYRYINHAVAFVSLFRQPSTVFRNFALNRYPIPLVALPEREIFYFISNFADIEVQGDR